MTSRPRMAAGMLLACLLACALIPAGSTAAEPQSYLPRSCNPVGFESAPGLQAQRMCMNLGVTSHGTRPGTYLFVSPGGTFGDGVGMFQDDGTLVWWHPSFSRKQSAISVVHYHHHPYLAIWSGTASFEDPFGAGTVSLYNEHYQRVGGVTSKGSFGPDRIDFHEFRITPQGNALFGIYDPVGARFRGRRVEVYRYVVQKVSLVRDAHGIHSGRLLFQWNSLKHVPLSQSRTPAPSDHTVWDYFHGNTVSQDPDGNLIVSARSTWGIYKVNVRTGHIMWEVGARGDRTVSPPWSFQHDVVPIGHDRYSLFDDGAASSGCSSSAQHPSRGLIIQVRPSRSPAGVRLLHAYTHSPSICSGFCGSMQLIPGGDVLINWGEVPEVTEYGRGGGSPLIDLSMSDWSCRGSRFAWTGKPLTRPAVAARSAGSDTHVWASWNGSTQVAAWRVLAGADSGHLSAVGPPRPKQGFETRTVLPGTYNDVAVQALDDGGRVLATSRSVRPGG
jgi:Arylsulfotransferase (ASST)